MSIFDPPITETPEAVPEEGGARLWQRVGDFRAGIHTAVAPTRPSGYAQESKTFQCYASTAGSLIAAPRLVRTITRPVMSANPLVSEQYRIVGLYANAPVYSTDGSNVNTSGVDEVHTELLYGVEWWETNTGSRLRLDVSRYTRNKVTPGWESIWSRTYDAATYSANTRPRAAFFDSQRSNVAAPLVAGPQVVGFVFSGNARTFPDSTTLTTALTTSTLKLPGDDVDDPVTGLAPTNLVAHQGRFVIFPLLITGDGTNQVYVSTESAYWTPPNNASIMDTNLTTYFNILGGSGDGSGYQAFGSLTADELFLVKVKGGGLFISGDLNTPTERTLPYVQSTGLTFTNGVTCWLGFVYPVDASGIWLWSGGDTAEHVTKHLRPDFWRPTTMLPTYADPGDQTPAAWGNSNMQLASWNEFVLVPNNWMWDTDVKGWWRILDPDVIEMFWWTADERGKYAWGAPAGWSTGTDPVGYEFSRGLGATYYSWQSHPLSLSVDRTQSIDELILCGQGVGTIKVTVRTPEEPDNPSIATFTFNGVHAQKQRQKLKAVGSSFTFQIESIGFDHDTTLGSYDPAATGGAPTVHWLDYSTLPNNQIANR